MRVVEVRDVKDIKRFHKLAREIYKNDPNWIPPLKQDIEKVFDSKKNKAHQYGSIERWILEDKEGAVIGRIAAFVHEKYTATMEQPTGGVGQFECIDDELAAHQLFDTAKSWLVNHNMEAMDGPINFGEKNMFWGLLTQNFEDLPSYGMTYNPPYYQRLFESYGFEVYYGQICYKRDMRVPLQKSFVEKSAWFFNDSDYRMQSARSMRIPEIAENFQIAFNNSWGGHHGFKEMSFEQAEKVVQSLKRVWDKDIAVFAFHDDQPIGFYINIPELNEIFRHVNGNLNWWGKLVFLYYHKRRVSRNMVGMVFGVDRKYHGKGIEGALMKWAEDHIVPLDRYDETTLNWIGDFNPKMLRVVEKLGAEPYRRLSTYRYLFDRNAPFHRMPEAE